MTLDIAGTYRRAQQAPPCAAPAAACGPDEQGYLRLRPGAACGGMVVRQLLRRGSGAALYRVLDRASGALHVAKVARSQPHFQRQAASEAALYGLLGALPHALAPRLVGVTSVCGMRTLVLQGFDVSLRQLVLLNGAGLPLQYVRPVARRLLQHVAVLGRLGVVHNRISPDSVVVNLADVSDARLVDFGAAFFPGGAGRFGLAPLGCRAPEQLYMLPPRAWTGKLDCFALGCVLYELHTGRPLFPASSEPQLVKQQLQVLGSPEGLWGHGAADLGRAAAFFVPGRGGAAHYAEHRELMRLAGCAEGWALYPRADVAAQLSAYDAVVRDFGVTGRALLRRLVASGRHYMLEGHADADYDAFAGFLWALLRPRWQDRADCAELLGDPFVT